MPNGVGAQMCHSSQPAASHTSGRRRTNAVMVAPGLVAPPDHLRQHVPLPLAGRG
jgi:hypothetical protein